MNHLPGIAFLQERSHGNPANYSLTAVGQLLAALGNPQDRLRSIHVAGTNGKGSTCAFLGAMLLSAGYKVGQFTSPHLTHLSERCLINGAPVALEVLDAALIKVQQVATQKQLDLSYFETIAAASFLVFAEASVDWAVIEVGLGGRLDATNCLSRPELSLITGISLDHTQILGSTVEAIAEEKSGILKAQSRAVIGRVTASVGAVIRRRAEELQIPCLFYGTDFQLLENELRGPDGLLIELPLADLALNGDYQRDNLALSAFAAVLLGVSVEDIIAGARRARWPGRLELRPIERKEQKYQVLFDAAHNPEGMQALTRHLHAFAVDNPQLKQIVVLFGVLQSKNWKEMLRQVTTTLLKIRNEFGISSTVVFTAPPLHQSGDNLGQNAVRPVDLVNYAGTGFAVADLEQALSKAESLLNDTLLDDSGLLVVCGSIYLMGEVRARLVDEPFRTFI